MMETVTIKSKSADETRQLGKQLAELAQPGTVITLTGELGAGKTVFAKGVAEGLQITERITSPTFTIVKEYDGTLPLYHMDVYRLEFTEEEIGLDEYFFSDGISVVEWAE